jgi:hypothetical protein
VLNQHLVQLLAAKLTVKLSSALLILSLIPLLFTFAALPPISIAAKATSPHFLF